MDRIDVSHAYTPQLENELACDTAKSLFSMAKSILASHARQQCKPSPARHSQRRLFLTIHIRQIVH